MDNVFLNLFNISIMASWLVIAIVMIRFIFKKIPKWISCILWAIVGLRLILPFSIESVFSLIPSANTIDTTLHQSRPSIQTGIEIVDQNVNEYLSSTYFEGVTVETNHFSNLLSIISIIWIIGTLLMFIYSIYSYYRLNRQVQASLTYKDNIYFCDDIDSPFILGVFKPKIYIPSYLDEKQMLYVLQHEQAHLKRKDHFYKPIGFTLLSVYWFNPILWIAYILLCRDIEAACDEKVIKDMNNTSKKEYSETLFTCSVQRNAIQVCPLAFGEVGVKERIKSVINYRKPSFWVLLLSVILCVFISISFLTVPKHTRIIDIKEESIYITLLDNVADIQLSHESNNIEINQQDEVNNIVDLLLDVNINKNSISKDRSENRDKTHQIGLIYEKNLNHITYLNINEDYTKLWIDDGVKPSFSYKVKNPQLLKEIFESYTFDEQTNNVETFDDEINNVETIDVNELISELSGYSNGITDEQYKNIKEPCIHPRAEYENSNIKVEIWSEPHELKCYFVIIQNTDKEKLETIYINEDDYENIKMILENNQFTRL